MTNLANPSAAPVTFNGVILRRARFDDTANAVTQSAQGKQFNVNLEVSTGNVDNDPRKAFVRIQATLIPTPDSQLFTELEVMLDGLFSVPAEGDPGALMEFCQTSGPSLLIPYVRQAITNLTAFTKAGLIILPPLNLVKLLTEQAARAGATTTK